MNQFTYSKAISGGEHNMNQMQPCAGRNCASTNPNLHSAECFEDYEKATGMACQEREQYKSQIERQCVEMQATIDLLKATVETLYMRLKPVMSDVSMKSFTNEVSPVASPLGLSINQYRQQTTAVIDDLAHIIESLEI